ncbi:calcineurin-like phosphoesterase family protein [Actinokineospora auranticolor]|uniref:Calcineurin-like phosphoesterase family protein n=1 Tax=Actinokineospora auranticolor TaxID=155976 RepID=A0A2S6GZ58_9PSEU|nr:calcineurin-like phosphoesterase family protein [Actinokineospora auranticolor]
MVTFGIRWPSGLAITARRRRGSPIVVAVQQDSPEADGAGATYVVGDVHGHRDELLDALREAGLATADGEWAGGSDHLWFLGDFVDRGPDGIGVIDLVRSLSDSAAAAGGRVETLLGNHEILLLGMHRFGDEEVPSDFGPRSFARSWQMNGGKGTDQEALTPAHVEWLVSRPVLALVGDHLLMHSDTTEYLGWGVDIPTINTAVEGILRSDDISQWWEVWRRMTTRYAFRGPDGEQVAHALLAALGGEQIVHGHSVIADQLGILPTEVDGPLRYAGGKVLGIDAGLFVGGPCLVVRLPWESATEEPDEADRPVSPVEPSSDEPAAADEPDEAVEVVDAEEVVEAEDSAEVEEPTEAAESAESSVIDEPEKPGTSATAD